MRHLAVLLLAGCTGAQIAPEAKSFSIEHGTIMFAQAAREAETHCKTLGMTSRHLGTDRGGFQPISRFECMPK